MGRDIPPSDPLHDLGLISVVKRPSRVVISAASTTKVSAGTNRHHVQDTRAMETLLAQLSHLLGFNMEHSCFFVGIPYLETRTVECKTIFSCSQIKQNHVSSEARRGSVSASDNCCHHFDRNFTVIQWLTTILSKR